jgi:hypothetical protein
MPFKFLRKIDWVSFFMALTLSLIGLSVIYSFGADNGAF